MKSILAASLLVVLSASTLLRAGPMDSTTCVCGLTHELLVEEAPPTLLAEFAPLSDGPVVVDFGTQTFNSFPGWYGGPAEYIEDGVRLLGIDNPNVTEANHLDILRTPDVGDRYLQPHASRNGEITRIDAFGELFSLLSIDIERVAGPATWIIEASSGATAVLTDDGIEGGVTNTFGPGFTNITHATITPTPLRQGTSSINIDNITVQIGAVEEPLPEPGVATSLGVMALLALLAANRTRIRAAPFN